MTENVARALIGQSWTDAVAELDWSGWYPVLDCDGGIDAVAPADVTLGEAAKRGWIYDDDADVYRIDWQLADIVVALLARDDGANGGHDAITVAIARDWLDAGFDDMDVRCWLDAYVCDADHARRLQAAGFAPDTVPYWGPVWLTSEELADILDPEEEEEAR